MLSVIRVEGERLKQNGFVVKTVDLELSYTKLFWVAKVAEWLSFASWRHSLTSSFLTIFGQVRRELLCFGLFLRCKNNFFPDNLHHKNGPVCFSPCAGDV